MSPMGTAARRSTGIPRAGDPRYASAPTIPIPSASEEGGSTTMFATGPMSDTIPKTGMATGAVAACATRGVASILATGVKERGDAATAQRSASGENTTRPATAATESAKPMSNAAGGECTMIAQTAAARADSASFLRPLTPATPATHPMRSALTDDVGEPVSRT